jgi:hypothetical protein
VLHKLSSWLEKHIGKKQLIILAVLYIAILCVMSIVFIPLIRANTGTMNIFDLQAKGYTLAYAKAFISAMGAGGKNVYLKAQLPLDFVYPAVYTLLYLGLAQKIFRKQLAPVFAATAVLCISDYLENSMTIVMLVSNELTVPVVAAASVFTVTKTILLYLVTCTLLLGALYRLAKRLKKRAAEQI